MEIQFQQIQNHNYQLEQVEKMKGNIPLRKVPKFKGRRSSNNGDNKFVGLRQRPSGRWVAEIKDTTQKIRMWLGTFEPAEKAARAYDEAACLLRGSNPRTNFVVNNVSPNSPLASTIKNLLKNKKLETHKSNPHGASSAGEIPPNTSTTFVRPNNLDTNNTIMDHHDHAGHIKLQNFDDFWVSSQSLSENKVISDAYMPHLSGLECDFEVGYDYSSSQNGMLWCGDNNDLDRSLTQEQEKLEMTKNVGVAPTMGSELHEIERVLQSERDQMTSLYQVNNEIQGFMDLVHDPIGTLWDLQPLCSFHCSI